MNLDAISAAAMGVLMPFADPSQAPRRGELVLNFRPDPDDFARVFAPEVVETARASYERLWAEAPAPTPKPGQNVVRISVCPSQEFGKDTPRAKSFPGAYANIANLLVPNRAWVAWKFTTPQSTTGMAYDGLVWMPERSRFAWFPKPWKFLTSGTGVLN